MTESNLINFTAIDHKTFPEHLDAMLEQHLQTINSITAATEPATWDRVMQPLEEMSNELERFWAPLGHLHAVVNSKELRGCYEQCLPKLSAYESAIGQNHALYSAISSIDTSKLAAVQIKIIEDALRDFKLSGVALESAAKKRFEAISTELSKLSNQFSNNILDAVHAYHLPIASKERMRGLPEHLLASSKALALEHKQSGYLLNLEQPTFVAVITYAEDRSLREELYNAYVTRASDKGPSAGKFDNGPLMGKILELRAQMAQLLGFANYAELSLATKMASSPQDVTDFLADLAQKAHSKACAEFAELQQFAQQELQLSDLQPWDIAFVSEKMLQQRFQISQEELRPYFPLPKVLSGLFSIIEKLYNVRLHKVTTDVWHADVECYALLDENDCKIGYLYMDLFARPHKRSGAWMDSMQSRFLLADGTMQLPIATLTCNFAKSVAGQPVTLVHEEVETLFHECGHCLHHLLTQVEYVSVSGVNGVEWDAVELPSQFFENWCWDKEALQLLSGHVETGEPLPNDIYANLLASKNFLSAMALVRQLEFSMFDFRIHDSYSSGDADFIADTLAAVRDEVSVVPVVSYNRFANSFSHIFAGGYAAGYYSYKWAEVLSADAFAKFEEEGIFNPETGAKFLQCILAVGGSKKAEQAFADFRGRAPEVAALLRHTGIEG